MQMSNHCIMIQIVPKMRNISKIGGTHTLILEFSPFSWTDAWFFELYPGRHGKK